MSSDSNTPSTDSTDGVNANVLDMFVGMSIYDVIIQELNNSFSQRVLQRCREVDAANVARASTSNPRRRRRKYINRHWEDGEEHLMKYYFYEDPTYDDTIFRRRFQIRKHLFLRIASDLENRYTFFKKRLDCARRMSFFSIHKCTAAVRMLAYDCPADMLDETLRMGESTILSCLQNFMKGICAVYEETYLRQPDVNVIARLLQIGEARGFLGRAPDVQFAVNGRPYNLCYYLENGIYPKWVAFVKNITLPQAEKDKLFAMHQEGARKDVERVFGVLQSSFAIVRGPVNIWDIPTISDIMYACIILHNMNVEDEHDSCEVNYDPDGPSPYEGMQGMETPMMGDMTRGANPLLQEKS